MFNFHSLSPLTHTEIGFIPFMYYGVAIFKLDSYLTWLDIKYFLQNHPAPMSPVQIPTYVSCKVSWS